MGCKSSSEKKDPAKKEPEKKGAQSAENQDRKVPQEQQLDAYPAFLNVVLPEYKSHIDSLSPEEAPVSIRSKLLESFANTTYEFAKHVLRVKSDTAAKELVAAVKQHQYFNDQDHNNAIWISDRVVDDVSYQILKAWYATTEHDRQRRKIRESELKNILRTFGINDDADPSPQDDKSGEADEFSFSDVCAVVYGYFDGPHMRALFAKYSEGNPSMSAKQLSLFIGPSVNEEAAQELIVSGFGGVLCRFNFAPHFCSLAMNGAVESSRSLVWHDMTLPMPHYSIHTAIVTSDKSLLQRSLVEGARAFELNVYTDAEKDQLFISDTRGGGAASTKHSFTLQEALELIKVQAFQRSSYPVVLAFLPSEQFDLRAQGLAAKIVHAVFEDRLAKGLMFDGARVNDPRFSPAALQDKVLVLTTQTNLVPYVGVYAADMARKGLGVRVTDVRNSSPAAHAGVLKDDWFTHVNGSAIEDRSAFKQVLQRCTVGDELTLRRENLTEVKIVVGGIVPPNTDKVNAELADTAFLNAIDPTEAPPAPENVSLGSQKSAGSYHNRTPTHATASPSRRYNNHRAPWDAAIYTDLETPSKQLVPGFDEDFEDEHHQNGSHHNAMDKPYSANETFGLLGLPEDAPESALAKADALGIQFVFNKSEGYNHYQRGKFAENGNCGYVAKADPSGWVPQRWDISVEAPPPRVIDFNKLRKQKSPTPPSPTSPTRRGPTTGLKAPHSCSCRIFGDDANDHQQHVEAGDNKDRVMSIMGSIPQSVAILRIRYRRSELMGGGSAGGQEAPSNSDDDAVGDDQLMDFVAALPLTVLQEGRRAVTVWDISNHRQTTVLCNLSLRASAEDTNCAQDG